MLNYENLITKYSKLQYLNFVPEIRLFVDEKNLIYNILKQELGNDTQRPFWTQGWAGGLALSRFIMDHPDIVKDKHVVDYCSGSGIVGIAAALSGAAKVTCVDTDQVAHSAILLNARANKVNIEVSDTTVNTDLVLSGDPAIDPQIFDFLRKSNSFIGCPIRNKNYLHGFNFICSYMINTTEPISQATFVLNSCN